MKKSVISTLTLVVICGVMAILLAAVNHLTAPIIEKNQNAAANEALLVVMPDGVDFTPMDISGYTLPASVEEAFTEAGGGHVFRLNVTGYSPNMIVLCGIKADGTVSGAVCLSSGETLGYEKTFGANFEGLDAASVGNVDTISGATRTTAAYRTAVTDALNAAIILGGGDVDLRTPEEILQDNLSAALPAGESAFEKLFITEALTAAEAVYAAENGTGYVVIIGDVFYGVNADGTLLTEADADTATAITADVLALAASELSDVDVTLYEGIHKNITSVKATATGNYVFEIKGAGYGITGGDEYHPASGEYILIRVAMSAEGKILDCLTLSEEETDGIGSVCAEESFYGQFVGKTEETYNDIDGISGATMTTDGYKKAILRVFEALTVLKGGVQ